KIAEVMVRAHLAAIGTVHLAHHLLDEGVAGLRLHGLATVLLDNRERVPGQARVMDDAGALFTPQEYLGQQAYEVITFDEGALFVEEETAVEVAVPGEADVGLVL